MHSVTAVSALTFVPAGIVSVALGQPWLGIVSAVYGIVHAAWYDCVESVPPYRCSGALLFDVGLLSPLDRYLQRLVALYALTAFLFKNDTLRSIARGGLAALASYFAIDQDLTNAEKTAVMTGAYIAVWTSAALFRLAPPVRRNWAIVSSAVYAVGALAHAVEVGWVNAEADASTWAGFVANVFLAADVALIAASLRPPPKTIKTK